MFERIDWVIFSVFVIGIILIWLITGSVIITMATVGMICSLLCVVVLPLYCLWTIKKDSGS